MDRQYARFEIEFQLGGIRRKLESLISEFGARRIFDTASLPKNVSGLTGQKVEVNLHGLRIPGVFTKEILPEASFYNIRFRYEDERTRERLRQSIIEAGFPSPWRRSYPRIFTAGDSTGAPMPTVALIDNPEEVEFYRVVNFTLGGMLLEGDLDGISMPLGHRFYFQIMVSNGSSISGIWGKVVRIDEDDPGTGVIVRRFGVQVVSMSAQAQVKYKQLIIDYCSRLKTIYEG